jgi:hypothetical protein
LSAKLQGDAKRNYIRALVYHFVQDAQNAGANAPILAEAPITQETITYRDNRAMATREQAKRSMRYLIGTSLLCALVAALQIVQLIIREPQHPCVLV